VPPELKQLQESLDRKAQELARYLEVVRLPMPMPYRGTFRTYANAALVNGRALVPSYRRFGWRQEEYPDAALAPYYEQRAREVYRAAGYDVQFLEADGLAFNGGAWRCVTAPIPATQKGR
jgi:hypothetical protein